MRSYRRSAQDQKSRGVEMKRIQLAVVVLMVVSTGVMALAGPASAKGRHHHQVGKGGPTAPMTIQIDPNPLVETLQSYVLAIVQVETSPSYAGDIVEIQSPQFIGSCAPPVLIPPIPAVNQSGFFNIGQNVVSAISTPLDNEGNATVVILGNECAPGTDLIEASMIGAPFFTATTEFTVTPPAVTTPGVYGYPTTSGTVTGGEVETGDSGLAASSVYAVFYVETNPVYAGQLVDISSNQLGDRCGNVAEFLSLNPINVLTTTLDDDGNAVFLFEGSSCAAGTSVVTADVEVGTHPTYTTTFTILPPQVTI
jgi:hypothetical protein